MGTATHDPARSCRVASLYGRNQINIRAIGRECAARIPVSGRGATPPAARLAMRRAWRSLA